MNTLSIPVVAMASISLYVGFYHLLIYFRRRQHREDLTFAFLCFAIVFYDAFCVGLYNATSVSEGAQWQRAQFISLAVFVPAFLWFVSDYTRQKPDIATYWLSIFYLLAMIVQLVDRSDLTFPLDRPSIKYITLPSTQPIVFYEATLGPFTTVQSLMGLVASTYILIMSIRYFRRGYKREAMPLILAIGFMYAAGLHDTFVSNGVYDFIYLVEYAYLAVILLMTYSLSNIVMEATMAKEELRKSEERFRSLVETTSDWVWEVDANGVYTYTSPKVNELLGYKPEELIGRTPFDLMPMEEGQRLRSIFQDIASSRSSIRGLENTVLRKDGQRMVLETSGEPFFDAYGKLLGYRGIDRDITERKGLEEALEKRVVALTQPLDAPDGIEFETLFNLSDIQHLQDLFAESFGVAALITRPDGTPITQPSNFTQFCSEIRKTPKGIKSCNYSDAVIGKHNPSGPNIQLCLSAGLCGAGASITVAGRHIANWLIGQVRNETHDEEEIMKYAREIGADETAFRAAYRKVPIMSQAQFEKIARVLFVLASQLSTLAYQTIQQARFIAERKRAEEALQAKTEELDRYFTSSLDLLCIADTDGYFHRLNPEWEATLGYTVAELEGRQFLEFVHPEDMEATIAAISQLRAQQQVLNFENRYRCKDGSYRWIEWRSYPAGQMIYAVARDITERRRVEEALRESEQELRVSEERYRRLVEVSPTATWIAKDDIITYANPAALQILGATDLRQVVGRPSFDFIHPDYHPLVKERILQMREERKTVPLLEEKYIRLDGSIVDVEVIATPFFTSNGPVIQVFFQDITKRKRAEEALRASEQRHRALVESQIDLVSRYLPDTNLTFVNDAYCKFYGKTREELIGQSYMFAIAPEYREQVARETKQLAEANGTVTGEYINYRYDGKECWIQWVVKCITDESGHVVELQAVGRDITQLKQVEAERERLIAELENKNVELERFTYTVSHDLKAPLITIRGFLGFIEQDARSGNMNRLENDVQRISAAADKMQRLLSELLELSRIGRLMNAPQNIPFRDLAQEAIKLMDGRLQERNVEIKVQQDLPVIFGDAQRLSEVVQNLLDNAIKFVSEQTEPFIEIGSQGEENGKPILFVRDNGIGIAPEHHERIFGLFNKLDPRAEGTGVGLVIVKRIIEVHGGRIWVESEEGKGATFYFTLGKGFDSASAKE